jgi:hypothetical protein
MSVEDPSKNKVVEFPAAPRRQEIRQATNERLINEAGEEGLDPEDTRVMKAFSEKSTAETEGRPFRFAKGRKVRVVRGTGQTEEGWEVHGFSNDGVAVAVNTVSHQQKVMTWKELYAVNPELELGDIVTVPRKGGAYTENGWKVASTPFQGTDGFFYQMVTRDLDGEGHLEKEIRMEDLKRLNP